MVDFMKKKIVIAVITALLIIGAAGGVFFWQKMHSPEAALAAMALDVKENGVDALKYHLTDSAWETVENVFSLLENPIVTALLPEGGAVKEKFAEIEWTVTDVLKSKNQAEVELHFLYEEIELSGTIRLTMVKSDGAWKVDGLQLPEFDESVDLTAALKKLYNALY